MFLNKMIVNNQKLKANKGFMLVELIAYMSILLIALSIGAAGIYNVKKVINNQNVNFCNTSIIDMVNYSKMYCRKANMQGFLQGDNATNEMYLYVNNKIVKKYHFPNNFTFEGMPVLHIDSNGFTSNSFTIEYIDSYSNSHYISICVGSAYVQESY